VLTALLCTFVPLATWRRSWLTSALQSASRTATEGRRSRRIRSSLIAVEIAASLTLLAGTTLMLRSVVSLLQTDLGFSAERMLIASITLRQNRYPDARSRIALADRITARLARVPGAESVGLTTAWPLQQGRPQPVEKVDPSGRASARAAVHGVSDEYFRTLRIPVASGRTFANADRIGSAPVAVISETLSRRLWPGGEPVGKRLTVPQDQEQGDPMPVERQIVGVVRDVRQDPADVDLADVYVPMLQQPTRFAVVLVRTAAAPSDWLTPLRVAFREIDPELAMDRARPLQLIVDEATARPRFLASLLASFALVATLLSLVGVYGVVAYAVRQREREIAVRMAVGADPGRITRQFVREGGIILLIGLTAGVLTALAGGRLLESQLIGVTSRDPIALAVAVLAFAAAGFVAIWWPSRRAAATDPALALRLE
jgi:putative ABC transport system permease protein